MVFKKFGRQVLATDFFDNSLIVGLGFVLRYFCFWIAYFTFFRALFLIYHLNHTAILDKGLVLGSFYHGSKMDLSFSSYLCLLIFFILAVSVFISPMFRVKCVAAVTLGFLIFISFISVADLELFTEWGFRIDATPVAYLTTPKEMAVSAASSPYLLLLSSMVVITGVSFWGYLRLVHSHLKFMPKAKIWHAFVYLILGALMIIPIRGGLQLAPMNQSVAFFSKNDFANQAAINVPWNFFWSLSKQLYSRDNPYKFMDQEVATEIVQRFYQPKSLNVSPLLNTNRPNIIIILWESLTSNVVPELNGSYSNVVPEFEALISEGILFRNFYASGNRSDKGIVAVLSGYPAQPKRSIVKIPTKSSNLPVISKILNQKGYYTGYFHGGELAFANIKSYLFRADFNTIVGKASFKSADMNSKWGAHDHVVLDRALKEITRQPTPFFNLIFTLSSHEPFDIPTAAQFPGDDLESLYKSSLFYSDQSIGQFIRSAKKEPWYQNTLVIILADHGHRLLGESPRYDPGRFRVPMLWLGGALALKDSVISKTCAQTDIAKTLLNQMQLDSTPFIWSRDIFDSVSASGAFYVYQEGIGFVQGNEHLVYDHPSRNLLMQSKAITNEQVNLTKAHLQSTFQDYLNK